MNSPINDDNSNKLLSVPQAGCLLVFLSPLIAFVGAMRWNIKDKLDADLATILTWFCDSALLFLLLLPLASTKYKSKLTNKFFAAAAAKVYITVLIFSVVLLVACAIGVFAAFHYLISELFFAVFGQR